jgi:hypothetical protein
MPRIIYTKLAEGERQSSRARLDRRPTLMLVTGLAASLPVSCFDPEGRDDAVAPVDQPQAVRIRGQRGPGQSPQLLMRGRLDRRRFPAHPLQRQITPAREKIRIA